jgi:tetratricopeptide (TPR) repeat protein
MEPTMSKKLTKEDLKRDAMTQELQKGFAWTTKHMTGVIIFLIAFVVLGAGYSAFSYFDTKKEEESQNSYYKVEAEYLAQKTKFETFEAEANKPKDEKKNSKKDQKTKSEDQTDTDKPQGLKASGEVSQDYGKVVSGFESVINKDPKSNAALMAALNLADIYSSYQQSEKALSHLEQVKPNKNLLSAMVLDRKAALKADSGDCKTAVGIWDQVLNLKASEFMASEIKLKKGLCFEAMNDFTQAKAMYMQAKVSKEGEQPTPIAKTAEKYLHLLASKEAIKNQ